MVEHSSVGVEGDKTDQEALRLGDVGVGLGALEDALDEVSAAAANELMDRKFINLAIAVEGGAVRGRLEEGDKAVGVGLGSDGGLCSGDGIIVVVGG